DSGPVAPQTVIMETCVRPTIMDMELSVCGPTIGGMFLAELPRRQPGVTNRRQAPAKGRVSLRLPGRSRPERGNRSRPRVFLASHLRTKGSPSASDHAEIRRSQATLGDLGSGPPPTCIEPSGPTHRDPDPIAAS